MAFSQVLGSVSFLVDNVGELASFSAGVGRLQDFQAFLDGCTADGSGARTADAHMGMRGARVVAGRQQLISHTGVGSAEKQGEHDLLLCDELDVAVPGVDNGLVRSLSLRVMTRSRLLIVGPSGCGKTSLLRTLCGLWQPARGSVVHSQNARMLFLPQKPYMILGTMRMQLCYPNTAEGVSDEHLLGALRTVRLLDLAEQQDVLDSPQEWGRTLSQGEQQRVAFARVLLTKPDLVFLDEATSALDEATEGHLYGLLTGVAVVSVGHRRSLRRFHDQTLALGNNGRWEMTVL